MKLIYLFSVLTMLSCTEKYTGEVSFKSCAIKYDVLDEKKELKINDQYMVGNQWRFESAKQNLALCLCEKYLQNRDEEIKQQILEIYRDDFEYYHKEKKFKPIDFDSILKNRKEVFD
ncbi:MAG: hypothetical protein EOO19_10865, partial [Chryseobacterium sp.]